MHTSLSPLGLSHSVFVSLIFIINYVNTCPLGRLINKFIIYYYEIKKYDIINNIVNMVKMNQIKVCIYLKRLTIWYKKLFRKETTMLFGMKKLL